MKKIILTLVFAIAAITSFAQVDAFLRRKDSIGTTTGVPFYLTLTQLQNSQKNTGMFLAASNLLSGQTTLGTIATYTNSGGDANLQLTCIVSLANAISSGTFRIQYSYTNTFGNVITGYLGYSQGAAAATTISANIQGIYPLNGFWIPLNFRIKAGTTLTITTTGSASGDLNYTILLQIYQMPG